MKKLMSTTLIFVLLCTLLSTFALPAAAAKAKGVKFGRPEISMSDGLIK